MTARLVGLDFGGTTIKGGAADADGRELAAGRRPFDRDADADAILDRAADLARELTEGARLEALGVGCAGVFDREAGVVLASANMRNLEGTSLTRGLAERLGVDPARVVLENDANLAAYGEQWVGAGRGVPDLCMVTLGTGVGGGFVLDGRLFVGPTGMAGEVGHIAIVPRGAEREDDVDLECGCGGYGCVERLVSATAALARARVAGIEGTLPEIVERSRAADGPERALLTAIGHDLAVALAVVVRLVDVRTFVVGGGFGAALDELRRGAEPALERRRYGGDPIRLLDASLGGRAGWIGAARLARDVVRG